MTKNQIHEWHERREEDGRKLYYRGYWNSREWQLRILTPEVEAWQDIEKPTVEQWLSLRDVLWRKYQRKRLPVKFIEKVDEILGDLGVTPGQDAADSTKPSSVASSDSSMRVNTNAASPRPA